MGPSRGIILMAVWWVASALTSIASKQAMDKETYSYGRLGLPFTDLRWLDLTCLQLLLGTLVSTVWIKYHQKTSPITNDTLWNVHITAAVAHLVGNLATNASFAAVNSCITMMIKACEPLFTMLLHYGLFNAAPAHTMAHAVYVSIICAGAIFFISSDVTFNGWGIGAAFLSNLAFPIRNIVVKSNFDSNVCSDGPIHGYASMSMHGFFVILPIVLLKLIITQSIPLLGPTESLVSCTSHVLYSMASLSVLKQVIPLTHAILNLSKRIVVIFTNIIYFRTPVTNAMYLGVFVFVCGNLLYLFGKKHVKVRISLLVAICVACIINWNNQPQTVRINIMTSWVYDQPMPRKIGENIHAIHKKYPAAAMTVYCGTAQCIETITNLNSSQITSEFLVIGSVVESTPLEGWFNRHPLNKVLVGAAFEDHLQIAVQLGLLWHYGGMYIDPAITLDSQDQHSHSWAIDKSTHNPWIVNELAEISAQTINRGILDFSYFPPQNIFLHRLAVQFVKSYQNYSRNNTAWPLHFDIRASQWDLYRQCSVSDNCPESRSVNLGKIFSTGDRAHYGTLEFDKHVQIHKSLNFGDTIQSFPGLQIMPFVDTFLERDDLSWSPGTNNNFTIFFNAFWNLEAVPWPPQSDIQPMLLSMHAGPSMKLLLQKQVDYIKRNGPIGCRDMNTYNFLKSIDVPAYFSACLTLMLKNPYDDSYRTNKIYLVDVDDNVKRFIPQYILDGAIDLRHRGHMPNVVSRWSVTPTYDLDRNILESRVGRFAEAYRFIDKYATAKLVITQRIHAALPSVAFGTPVVFISSNNMIGGGGTKNESSDRVQGLESLFHTIDTYSQTEQEISQWVRTFNWSHPPPNPDPGQVMRFKATFWNVIRRDQHLYDSARKFGMLPLTKVPETAYELTFHVLFEKNTLEDTLDWFHIRTIESILYHHPFSKILIYSNTLSQDGFNVFTEAGYAIKIYTYNINQMMEEVKATGLTADSIAKARKTSRWYIHEATILRTLIMYIYGGIYIDPGVVLMKPINNLGHNVVAYQANTQFHRKVVLMRFDKGHVLLGKQMESLAQCLKSDDTACLDWLPDNWKDIQVLDNNYFYLFEDMKSCGFLNLSRNPSHHEVLKTDHYGVILNKDIINVNTNGKLTEGTICKILLNNFCVLCNNQY